MKKGSDQQNRLVSNNTDKPGGLKNVESVPKEEFPAAI
jgi:hypothetical protein